MSPVSRGFRHLRRAPAADGDRVPPGQHVTKDFPVLSAGPTPHRPVAELVVYRQAPGTVVRCRTCGSVLMDACPTHLVTRLRQAAPRPGT